MTSYGVAEAAGVLGVSDDTLRRWIDAGRVPASREGSQTRVHGTDLAALALSQADSAQDRGTPRSGSVSARNRLRGIVTAVKTDPVMSQVEMVCGTYRIVSLMSTEAAEQLGLEPGVLAIASVKSTNVVVELP